MENYFELDNAAGDNLVMINDQYQNMTFAAKGTGTASEQYGTYGAVFGTITWTGVGGDRPILALRASSGCALFSQTRSGNTYTWRVVFDAGTNYTYYIFNNAANYAPSNSGMVIKDASGNVLFDAYRKYMRVVGILGAGAGIGLSLPSSSNTYAIAPCVSNARLDVVFSASNQRTINQHFQVAKQQSTSVNAYSTLIYTNTEHFDGTGTNESYGEAASTFLVLDVTHF